jgi:hypothetical protein
MSLAANRVRKNETMEERYSEESLHQHGVIWVSLFLGPRKTLIFNINVEPEGMTDIKPHFGKIPAVRVLFRNKSEADFEANCIPQV